MGGNVNAGPGGSTSSSLGGSTTDGGDAGDGDAGPNCMSGQKVCNGMCVDMTDPKFGCDPVQCTPCMNYANADATCVSAMCTLGNCHTGFSNCDGNMANGCEAQTGTDPMNCGTCGNICTLPHATAGCTAGACSIANCDSGWTDCDGKPGNGCEANVQNDPNNCGVCGMMCTGMDTCMSGACVLSTCPKGTQHCPGDPANQCATTLGTTSNCNFCGNDCQAMYPNAQVSCVVQGNGWTCNVVQCKPGYATCDQTMPCGDNTTTDANNCASCNNACPFGPNSTAVCNNSVCGLNCSPGFLNCGQAPSLGCPVQGQTDPANCGGCGNVCNTPNATPGCAAGMCTISQCNTGYLDCNKVVSDGCEINSLTDPKNCNGCGNVCSVQNGTAACNVGACAINTCNTGFANCDGKYSSGCNVNTNTDTSNCGGCNMVCNLPHATATCGAGKCAIASCNSGYQDCNTTASDGCEINLQTDTSNCGACGHVCVTPNGTPSCVNGVCGILSCNTGYQDCDGLVPNGCEVNTNTDPSNCGACAAHCNLMNATSGCAAGKCTIIACSSGWTDCDGMASNGCEINTANDPNNCGVCKKVCSFPNSTSGTCSSGICSVGPCTAGFADCDSDPTDADGCETNISNNVQHCGSCTNVCSTPNATPACKNSACAVGTCNTGFGDCDGAPGNGCEVNLTNTPAACGSCNTNCASVCVGHVTMTGCSNSTCTIASCAATWYDIDGKCSNGCECPQSTTSLTCNAAFNMTTTPLSAVPASAAPYQSNIIPALIGVTTNVAWAQVTFSNPSNNTNYHPQIVLTDPTNEFVMDVNTNCSGGTLTCANENTPSVGVTHWETLFTAGDPNNIAFQNIFQGTLYVRIYRKSGATVTCNNFTLNASQ
jgi:hypothetical protein